MAQKKKSAAPVAKAKRSPAKGSAAWRGSGAENRSGMIAVIAVVGVVAMLAAYLLDINGVFALNRADGEGAQAAVRINEFQSENMSTLVTETGDVPDWIEITNTGSESVQVGKYSLLLESNINRMFAFPEYELQPGENLLVYAGGVQGNLGEWNAPFKLEASGGDTLVLLNAQGKAVDGVTLPELEADQSYSRNEDGSWQVTAATPGMRNDASASAGAGHSGVQVYPDVVQLSEAMSSNTLYFADENGECHDYVELHNTSSSDVRLEGWYLSDSSDKLKRWSFPDVVIPANGYLAVHCSGDDRTADSAHLHTDFKIGSDGEDIYLSRPDGHTVSVIEMPALENGQAYSFVDGAWTTDIAPTPGMANTADSAAYAHMQAFGDRSGGVSISEIMASPITEDYDWVEIYNGSAQAMDLTDYGLSDTPDKPRKWQFPQGTILQPGQYMLVCLSGTEQDRIGGYLNASFALSSEGGYTLTLAGPNGDVFDAVYLPQQYSGVSYGRIQGRTGFCYFGQGTPAMTNNAAAYAGRAREAVASVQGGLFTSGESFMVELSAPAGSRIYYTLDCTDPTEASTPYTGPIQVSGTTILRSRVYRDGYMPSFIDTQSYLYDVSNDSRVHVVSVVSDPSNLYGAEGIISNYKAEWEKEGHIEIFKADGENIVSQAAGLSLHGADSRKLPIKSFNVIARSRYGDRRIDYPVFSRRDYQQYQSILLRPSGEDYNLSFMRDTLLSSLMRDTSVLYQEYEISICYLNGEYHTLYYIRERINEHSICQFEGWEGMEDVVDIVKGNESVTQGSNATFAELLKWIKNNDTSTQAAYDYIDSQIDIQNFIEYMTIQIFVGNTDTLNVRRYRNELADGKWRWALFDLDWAFFNDTDSIGKWLTPGGAGAGRRTDNTLFIGCMKNPIFCEQFLTYFGERMATDFRSENIVAKIWERYEQIKGILPQYMEKWDISLTNGIKKMVDYAEERPNKLINTYFRECFKFNDAQMEKYFGAAMDEIEKYASGKAGE